MSENLFRNKYISNIIDFVAAINTALGQAVSLYEGMVYMFKLVLFVLNHPVFWIILGFDVLTLLSIHYYRYINKPIHDNERHVLEIMWPVSQFIGFLLPISFSTAVIATLLHIWFIKTLDYLISKGIRLIK